MRFESVYWLLAAALPLTALALRYLVGARAARPTLLYSRVPASLRGARTWRTRAFKLLPILHALVLIVLAIGLARPQKGRSDSVITSEGIDIMLVVDVSQSMIAEDFGQERTRLAHVVDVMKEFIEKRPDDRIGVVSFGRHAYTRCPMTLDHGLLVDFLERLFAAWERDCDSLARKLTQRDAVLSPAEEDLGATAIGDGLVAAIARLEKSKAKSRIAILLSDGESNAGDADPNSAAELAARFGIKVYTVGAGSNDPVRVTTYDRFGRKGKQITRFNLDEATLTSIADKTEGRYFAARDRAALEATFAEIDELERSELVSRDYREWDERFHWTVWLAALLLVIDAVAAATVLRSVP